MSIQQIPQVQMNYSKQPSANVGQQNSGNVSNNNQEKPQNEHKLLKTALKIGAVLVAIKAITTFKRNSLNINASKVMRELKDNLKISKHISEQSADIGGYTKAKEVFSEVLSKIKNGVTETENLSITKTEDGLIDTIKELKDGKIFRETKLVNGKISSINCFNNDGDDVVRYLFDGISDTTKNLDDASVIVQQGVKVLDDASISVEKSRKFSNGKLQNLIEDLKYSGDMTSTSYSRKFYFDEAGNPSKIKNNVSKIIPVDANDISDVQKNVQQVIDIDGNNVCVQNAGLRTPEGSILYTRKFSADIDDIEKGAVNLTSAQKVGLDGQCTTYKYLSNGFKILHKTTP